jgi:homoserine O-acetyltransferase
MHHRPQQIAFNTAARQAIMADSQWRDGNYYEFGQPKGGLAVARMIGQITYMGEQSMEKKFARNLIGPHFHFNFEPDFQVEQYLHYKGNLFSENFDANSYLYLSKAMDYFDLSGEGLRVPGRSIATRFLVIAFKSDWLYPSAHSREIVRYLKAANVNVSYCEIPSTYGHDAFLVEFEEEAHLIKHFLRKVEQDS